MPRLLEQLRAPLDALPAVMAVPAIPALPVRSGPASVLDLKPPGSKSLTNRALLLAGLAPGYCRLTNALTDADDAQRMIGALRQLGVDVRPGKGGAREVEVWGTAGRLRVAEAGVTLNLNNAGTATRFLAAAAVLATGPVTIDGNERMRQRPIAELGEALVQLGCVVEYVGGGAPGCPPVRITPPAALPSGATVKLGTTASSQFVSALLLAGVFLPEGLTIRIDGEVTSPSYIRMTLWLLARLGAMVQQSDDLTVLRVRGVGRDGRGLASFTYDVEPDASGATPFWGAAAILPGFTCRVLGLSNLSLQGDAKFPSLLARMGAQTQHEAADAGFIGVTGPAMLEPILADMTELPDAAMALAAVACFAEGTSILRGLRTLRVKETDRIEAVRKELTKVGVVVENPVKGDDGALTVTPPVGGIDCSAGVARVEFETYDDHRMAMSLALIALRRPNTFIKNPRCVEKTYPSFWADMATLIGLAGRRA